MFRMSFRQRLITQFILVASWLVAIRLISSTRASVSDATFACMVLGLAIIVGASFSQFEVLTPARHRGSNTTVAITIWMATLVGLPCIAIGGIIEGKVLLALAGYLASMAMPFTLRLRQCYRIRARLC